MFSTGLIPSIPRAAAKTSMRAARSSSQLWQAQTQSTPCAQKILTFPHLHVMTTPPCGMMRIMVWSMPAWIPCRAIAVTALSWSGRYLNPPQPVSMSCLPPSGTTNQVIIVVVSVLLSPFPFLVYSVHVPRNVTAACLSLHLLYCMSEKGFV